MNMKCVTRHRLWSAFGVLSLRGAIIIAREWEYMYVSIYLKYNKLIAK